MQTTDGHLSERTGIVVSGTGRVAIDPEVASLEVGVSLAGPDLARAREAAATKIGAATRYLIGAGVAERDIKTTRLSVHTSYDRQASGNQASGRPTADTDVRQQTYHLSTGVAATIRNLDSAESIVNDLFAEVGDGLAMNGLTFGVEDPNTGRPEAIELAFDDAKEKASQLARLAGLSLGPVLAISEADGHHSGQPMMAMSRMAGGDIPISEGQLDHQATIIVRWAIDS